MQSASRASGIGVCGRVTLPGEETYNRKAGLFSGGLMGRLVNMRPAVWLSFGRMVVIRRPEEPLILGEVSLLFATAPLVSYASHGRAVA